LSKHRRKAPACLLRRCLPALVVLAPAALASAAPAAHVPAHAATHSCTAPRYPGLGYFFKLTVSGTSCSTGDKIVVAYYHCRLKHGKAGTCHSTVLGYRCHEIRKSIPTEVDARVTCTKGGATVVHYFQQDI
jgi:hypothetical protein